MKKNIQFFVLCGLLISASSQQCFAMKIAIVAPQPAAAPSSTPWYYNPLNWLVGISGGFTVYETIKTYRAHKTLSKTITANKNRAAELEAKLQEINGQLSQRNITNIADGSYKNIHQGGAEGQTVDRLITAQMAHNDELSKNKTQTETLSAARSANYVRPLVPLAATAGFLYLNSQARDREHAYGCAVSPQFAQENPTAGFYRARLAATAAMPSAGILKWWYEARKKVIKTMPIEQKPMIAQQTATHPSMIDRTKTSHKPFEDWLAPMIAQQTATHPSMIDRTKTSHKPFEDWLAKFQNEDRFGTNKKP